MYEKFTDRARKTMQLANMEAQRLNHEYIGAEHILLGLIQEGHGVAANVLKNLDVDLDKARAKVMERLKPGPDMVTMGKLPQTPRAKKVIEHAIEEARNLQHNYIGTEHLLLGLLREQHGIAGSLLTDLGVKLEDAREEVLNLLGVTADTEKLPPVGTLAKDPNCGPTTLGSVSYMGKTVDFRSFQVSPDGQTVTIQECSSNSQQAVENSSIPLGVHLFLDKLAGEVGVVKGLVKKLVDHEAMHCGQDAGKLIRVLLDLVCHFAPDLKEKLRGGRSLAAMVDNSFMGGWHRDQEVGWLDKIRDEGDEQCGLPPETVRPDALTYFGITRVAPTPKPLPLSLEMLLGAAELAPLRDWLRPLVKQLGSPNPDQSWNALLSAAIQDFTLTGSLYLWQRTTLQGVVTEVYRLSPETVSFGTDGGKPPLRQVQAKYRDTFVCPAFHNVAWRRRGNDYGVLSDITSHPGMPLLRQVELFDFVMKFTATKGFTQPQGKEGGFPLKACSKALSIVGEIEKSLYKHYAQTTPDSQKERCERVLQKMQGSPEGMWQTAAEAEDAATLQMLQAPIPLDRVRVAIRLNVIMVSARTASDAMTLDEGATLEGWAKNLGLQIVWLPGGMSHADMAQPSSETHVIGYSTSPNPLAEAAYPNADTPVVVQGNNGDLGPEVVAQGEGKLKNLPLPPLGRLVCSRDLKDVEEDEELDNTPKEVAAAITESPVETEEACPQGHHKLEGKCDRAYCSCRCPRCEREVRGL